MSSLYFKTGEFAALCGVKKDTLLHYAHIGILNPEKVEENGYRYYSAKQLYTFDLITALKGLDMPLSEIKAYLDHRSPEAFLELLKTQEEVLAEKRRQLEAVSRLLRETVASTNLALTVTPGTFTLVEMPEERYVVVEAPAIPHYDEPQFLLKIRSLLAWAKENGSLSFPPGDIIRRDSMEKGRFMEDFYYYKVAADIQGETVLRKPSGLYAVLFHRGGYDSLEAAYRSFWARIQEEGLTPVGDLFEEDLLHYLSTADPHDYVMKLSVQVARKK